AAETSSTPSSATPGSTGAPRSSVRAREKRTVRHPRRERVESFDGELTAPSNGCQPAERTTAREPQAKPGFEPPARRRIVCRMSRGTEAECLDEDLIAAFVDGQLNAEMVDVVDAHLASCRECLWLVTAAAVAHGGDEAQPAPPEPEPGPSCSPDRFERRHLIAQGGMGSVYYGRDREADAPVAIKELKPGLALSQPALLGRFNREAEILRRLDHPNIVKMIASVTVGDQQQIVMEYVAGG